MNTRDTLVRVKERTEMIEGLVRGLKVVGSEQNIENMRGIANLLRYNLLDLDANLSAPAAPAADAGTGESLEALAAMLREESDALERLEEDWFDGETQDNLHKMMGARIGVKIASDKLAAMSRAADRSQDGGNEG